jgi:hypothetical protein
VSKYAYEGADDWRYKDGTKLKGKDFDGTEIDSDEAQTPISTKCIILFQENVRNERVS